MRLLSVVLSLTALLGVAAQFPFFDMGGMDMFMSPPGFNEGPCIEKKKRTSKKSKPKPTPTNSFRQTGPAIGGSAMGPPQPAKVNHQQQQNPSPDPFYGAFNMFGDFGNMFDPFASLMPPLPGTTFDAFPPFQPAPARAKAQQPLSSIIVEKDPTGASKTAIGASGITIDYSKLTNSELRSLLQMAARHAGINTNSPPIAQSRPTGTIPSYTDLSQQLAELTELATVQRDKLSNANNAKQTMPLNNFRSPGSPGGRRKRRFVSSVSRRTKRQMGLQFDFMGMGGMGGMGGLGGLGDMAGMAGMGDMGNMGGMHMAFCSCMQRGDVEPDYILQSRKKWKCGSGLVCACNPGGLK